MKLYPLPNEFGTRINVVPQFVAPTWIAGWEIGNVVRIKSKALMNGDVPLNSNVKVKFIFVDGKMVAVGGKSEVSIVKKEKIGEKEWSPDSKLPNPPEEVSGKVAPDRSNKNNGLDIGAEMKFFELLARLAIADGDLELESELLRNYLLFLSGLMSDGDFRRKLRSIEEKTLVGKNIELLA